ncbi:MAG: arylesterase [Terracidiphilus sp.]|nr:arylesterase [Terracidiphilus sp.]
MYVSRAAFVSFVLILMAGLLPAATPRLIVCFGDSITAGYGLEAGQSFPAALQHELDAAHIAAKVANRGTSGATTKDAVAGIQSVLNLHPDVVIVEFGGNDGLRGLPLEATRRNLDQVLTALEAAHVRVLLAGITLPPNYGAEYIAEFQKIFRTLAAKHHTAFVPMLYKDLVHVPGTIQPDGIHPTAKGSAIIARTLLPGVKKLGF